MMKRMLLAVAFTIVGCSGDGGSKTEFILLDQNGNPIASGGEDTLVVNGEEVAPAGEGDTIININLDVANNNTNNNTENDDSVETTTLTTNNNNNSCSTSSSDNVSDNSTDNSTSCDNATQSAAFIWWQGQYIKGNQ